MESSEVVREEWGLHPVGDWITRCGSEGPIIFTINGAGEGAKARAMLAIAAPEMARALLAFTEAATFEEQVEARTLAQAALAKAGLP